MALATCPLCGKRVSTFRDGGRPVFEAHSEKGVPIADGGICDATGWVVEDADFSAPKDFEPGKPSNRRENCEVCGRSIAVDGGGKLLDHVLDPKVRLFSPCPGSEVRTIEA